jgi:hypothetical protein
MAKIKLRATTVRGIFEEVDGGVEPVWSRSADFDGEVRYWHQSGYGSLPESRIIVVPLTPTTHH